MSEHTASTKVAIHQPNYIPWIGYFHKMAQSDVFVYLDTVQFPRGQSFANRNQVKTPNGVTWLTIPISHPSGKEGKVSYREVSFAGNKWKKKHLKTLEMSYKKAPYFDEIYPLLEEHITANESFVDLTVNLNNAIADYLDINTEILLLSNLLEEYGQKTQLIVDICTELDADTYLSGTGGGKEYNDENVLHQNGITLEYDDFTHPEYPQLWNEFESHLSIIDLLFNCGPESKQYI